jgi:hypothetical protein
MFSFKTYDVLVETAHTNKATGELVKVTHKYVSVEQIKFLKLRYRILRIVESDAPSIASMVASGPLD